MQTFNYGSMVRSLVKPGEDIIATLTPERANLWHLVTGLAGETIELLGACKDARLTSLTKDTMPDPVRAHITEELGDIEFYLKALGQALDCGTISHKVESFDPDCLASLLIEAGNILDHGKKIAVYNKQGDAYTESVTKILDHLGAFRHDLDEFYSMTGLTREMALSANHRKLVGGKKPRYATGTYSDQQAQARADKDGVE